LARGEHKIRACGGHQSCRRGTDSRATASDDGDLAGELVCGSSHARNNTEVKFRQDAQAVGSLAKPNDLDSV
jgi:hypothetical protein